MTPEPVDREPAMTDDEVEEAFWELVRMFHSPSAPDPVR